MELFKYFKSYQKLKPDLESDKKLKTAIHKPTNPENETKNRHRSLRRTSTVISDIVKMNDFDFFGTITTNPKKIDRYDDILVRRTVTTWLKNQQRIVGKFNYLLVPERHKDGALHFHLIIGGYPKAKLAYSGKKDKAGRQIYNLKAYNLGFSNLTEIVNKEAVANYTRKYITKDMIVEHGKRRYWHSTTLKMPFIARNVDENLLTNEKPVYQHELFEKYELTNYEKTSISAQGSEIQVFLQRQIANTS